MPKFPKVADRPLWFHLVKEMGMGTARAAAIANKPKRKIRPAGGRK